MMYVCMYAPILRLNGWTKYRLEFFCVKPLIPRLDSLPVKSNKKFK